MLTYPIVRSRHQWRNYFSLQTAAHSADAIFLAKDDVIVIRDVELLPGRLAEQPRAHVHACLPESRSEGTPRIALV